MAATYTEISLEDMDKFLKRAFRALRPKQGTQGSEIVYDLQVSPNVSIRVLTSIRRGSASGRGVGEDAIRVMLVSAKNADSLTKHPPIVKRTQNWRDNLQDRIEGLFETYEDKDEYYEGLASSKDAQPSRFRPAPPPDASEGTSAPSSSVLEVPHLGNRSGGIPASEKQVRYLNFLLTKVGQLGWKELDFYKKYHVDNLPLPEEVARMTSRDASALIDDILSTGRGNRRYASEESPELFAEDMP